MDIFAHMLWTNVVYRKKYLTDVKNRLWAVFFGVAPDLVSFTPAFVYLIFSRSKFGLESFSSGLWVFRYASASYNYTHSLVSFAFVLGIMAIIRKGKIWWPIFGWALHIGIDIFTHHNFYETPFLYPLSGFKNNFSISWGEPWFMVLNYSAILVFYILIFTVWKRKDAKAKS